MSCHSRMESGLKKAPQDILLATNKEVRMRTDFFGRAHKIIHIDRCWNDTNCQSNCLPELSKLCPTLCVTGSERLSCPDSFLFCTEEHLMFQASAALPFFYVPQQPASTGSCVSEGTSLWRANYWLWDAAGGIAFAPSKSLWL